MGGGQSVIDHDIKQNKKKFTEYVKQQFPLDSGLQTDVVVDDILNRCISVFDMRPEIKKYASPLPSFDPQTLADTAYLLLSYNPNVKSGWDDHYKKIIDMVADRSTVPAAFERLKTDFIKSSDAANDTLDMVTYTEKDVRDWISDAYNAVDRHNKAAENAKFTDVITLTVDKNQAFGVLFNKLVNLRNKYELATDNSAKQAYEVLKATCIVAADEYYDSVIALISWNGFQCVLRNFTDLKLNSQNPITTIDPSFTMSSVESLKKYKNNQMQLPGEVVSELTKDIAGILRIIYKNKCAGKRGGADVALSILNTPSNSCIAVMIIIVLVLLLAVCNCITIEVLIYMLFVLGVCCVLYGTLV